MFIAGAAFSLREGIDELIHPSATSSFAVAYVALAISAVLDLISFRQSAGQMIHRARRYHREFLEESRATSDPTLRAVFVEDAVSVSGDVITLAALALNQITGLSIPQGVTAVGPGRAWVVARLDIDDDLRGAEVKSLVRGIESGMKRESENVYRVDIVPTGGVTI